MKKLHETTEGIHEASPFGRLLRHLREERGMTLEQMGSLCSGSFGRAYMSQIELGLYMPPRRTVEDLAGALRLEGSGRQDFIEVARKEAQKKWREKYEEEWGHG